jgi:hypothetical protein
VIWSTACFVSCELDGINLNEIDEDRRATSKVWLCSDTVLKSLRQAVSKCSVTEVWSHDANSVLSHK